MVALGCISLGCGVTVNFHRLNDWPTDRARHPTEDVEIYTTTEPPYEYVDVGMLEVRTDCQVKPAASAPKAMRTVRAASLTRDSVLGQEGQRVDVVVAAE